MPLGDFAPTPAAMLRHTPAPKPTAAGPDALKDAALAPTNAADLVEDGDARPHRAIARGDSEMRAGHRAAARGVCETCNGLAVCAEEARHAQLLGADGRVCPVCGRGPLGTRAGGASLQSPATKRRGFGWGLRRFFDLVLQSNGSSSRIGVFGLFVRARAAVRTVEVAQVWFPLHPVRR